MTKRKCVSERLIAISYKDLPKGMRQCGECREIKHKDSFHKDRTRASGVRSSCKDCVKKKWRRDFNDPNSTFNKNKVKNAEKNRESMRKSRSKWKRSNRDKVALYESNRRARVRDLPNTLTESQMEEINNFFDYRCCICDDAYEHMDHFIPLKVEKVGTTLENIVPMCSKCNISKRDRNPFEWIKTKPKQERERFNSLVEYLSYINGITGIRDYKAYVYKCFK